MPKITIKEFNIAGKTYKCAVWYTANEKFYLKDFPQEIQRAAQITPLGHATEEHLYEAYEEGIIKYENLIAVSRKVIIFRIAAAKDHLESKYNLNKSSPELPAGVSQIYNCKMGFVIEYDIKMIREVGNSIYLHYVTDDGKPGGSGEELKNHNYWKVIDYTAEREHAFKELHARFDKMLMAFINGFFEAEKFIDSIPTTKLLQ